MRGYLPVPLSTGIGEARPPGIHLLLSRFSNLNLTHQKKTEIRSETMSNIIDHQHLIDF